MGNVLPTENFLTKEYEHISGKRLLRAIRGNVASNVQDAIAAARKELLSSDQSRSHDEDYENMIKKMTIYLTQKYDIGEGILFGKTPLEVAEALCADQAIEVIQNELAILSKNPTVSMMLEKNTNLVRESPTVGRVDKDRAIKARERLKEFQREYNEKKK
eukprot:gene3977-4350_t